MRLIVTLAAVVLALAGCSKGGSDAAGGSAAPAAPVAATKPPAGQSWTDVVVKTPEGGYRMGNPDAPIKLVEYGSRLCPVCGNLAREGYQPLTQNYVAPGKVSFEFREFMVHGAPDLPPALIGLCVDKAAFFPVLEAMFADQKQFDEGIQKLTPAQQQAMQTAKPTDAIMMLAEAEGIIAWAQQHGVPEAKARQCLSDQKTIDFLTKVTQDKSNDGSVTGTPALFLNGRKLDALTWSQLDQALKAAGA